MSPGSRVSASGLVLYAGMMSSPLSLHRRHVHESQRAMVAAALANLSVGRPLGNRSTLNDSADLPPMSLQQAADLVHVSRDSA
jgi:hypothetical protein